MLLLSLPLSFCHAAAVAVAGTPAGTDRPGPVSKGFASITEADSNKELVFGLNLLPQFAAIIERGKDDW